MDPDLIRLILVILGVSLVAGIYLWDRYRKNSLRPPMVTQAPREPDAETVSYNDDSPELDSPAVAQTTVPDRELEIEQESDPEGVVEAAMAASAGSPRNETLDPEPSDIGSWGTADRDSDPQYTMDLAFDAHGDSDYLNTDPALYDEIERKIVVLHVVTAGAHFPGAAIEKAAKSVELRHGEMGIYHHHEKRSGKVLFSMASMIEPGSFPADDMAHFSTPGLTLFTQLPGAADGRDIFNAMIAAGRQLAELLRGELQDERHNKLTGQMEKHIAESIVEHRRRLQLARSRR